MKITLNTNVVFKCSMCGFGIEIKSQETTRDGVMFEVAPCQSCGYITSHRFSGLTLRETIEAFKVAILRNEYGLRDLLKEL